MNAAFQDLAFNGAWPAVIDFLYHIFLIDEID